MECKNYPNCDTDFKTKVDQLHAEIESLRQQLAAKEDELIREKAFYENVDATHSATLRGLQVSMNQQLAASQAYAAQLRDALKHCKDRAGWPETVYQVAKETIDLPQDRSALNAAIADELESMAEILDRGADYELYIPIIRTRAKELRNSNGR